MKFRVNVNATDSLEYIVNSEIFRDGQNAPDIRARAVLGLCERWFDDHDEAVLEIDTESETCVVVPTIEL